MDQEILVKDLRKLYRELDRQYGPVALMMLLAPDAFLEEAWDLIISARGFDPITRGEAIRKITELLSSIVDRKSWQKIIRATVLKTDDPFVREMNRSFEADEEVLNLHAAYVSGVEIPKAIVLQSKGA
jgi:hypothetical protein